MKNPPVHVVPVAILAFAASWAIAQEVTVKAPGGQGAPAQGAPPKAAPEQAKPAGAPATQDKATGGKPAGDKAAQDKTAGTKTAPKDQTKGTTGGTKPTITPGKGTTTGAPPKKATAPAKPKSAWQQFPLNPTTTMFLDFTESNPDAVISLFSRTSGITILKSPQFKSPITLTSAKAIKLDEAFTLFNTVLGFQNYELRKQGNFLLVAQKQPPPQPNFQAPPPPPQPVVKTYTIQNAKASDVAKVIVDIYGPAAGGAGGGQPQGGGEMMFVNGRMVPMNGGGGAPGGGNPNFKVTSDEYSNTIVVKAMPDEQTKIEALIKDLDKGNTQPLVTRLFKLTYVPAEQAVTAVEDLLTANTPTGRGAAKPQQNNNDYYYYNPYSSRNNQKTAGGQSATAVRQTNSISVNATKENMDLVENLLKNLDVPFVFADNTKVFKLQNAKAKDVADLLNKVFANQSSNNGGFFFLDFFGGGDGGNSRNNRTQTTDYGDEGQIVNTRDISGKVKIEADLNTNSIVVVTQPSNMRMVEKVVNQLDALTDQVVIETLIVEATLDKTTKLGVEFNFLGDLLGGSGIGGQNFGLGGGLSTATRPTGATYTLSGDQYSVFLTAVQADSRFRVLDTPRIFTSNNVEATIDVGQSVPYLRSANTSAVGFVNTNVDFEKVGVTLKVTPRVAANGKVTMEVDQSANDVAEFRNFGNGSAPLVNRRQATTTVSVDDGQTIALGGIIQHIERNVDQKVPVLGDLPLLGQLFRSTSRQRTQTELMVFLTPHIIRNNADAQAQRAKATNEMTPPTQDDIRKLIGGP